MRTHNQGYLVFGFLTDFGLIRTVGGASGPAVCSSALIARFYASCRGAFYPYTSSIHDSDNNIGELNASIHNSILLKAN